jgi:hypothetical protein
VQWDYRNAGAGNDAEREVLLDMLCEQRQRAGQLV